MVLWLHGLCFLVLFQSVLPSTKTEHMPRHMIEALGRLHVAQALVMSQVRIFTTFVMHFMLGRISNIHSLTSSKEFSDAVGTPCRLNHTTHFTPSIQGVTTGAPNGNAATMVGTCPNGPLQIAPQTRALPAQAWRTRLFQFFEAPDICRTCAGCPAMQ